MWEEVTYDYSNKGVEQVIHILDDDSPAVKALKQEIIDDTAESKRLWDLAAAADKLVRTKKTGDGQVASKSAINKAKKTRKQDKDKSQQLAGKVKRLKTQLITLQHRESIKGKVIVDKEGKVVRKYSKGEWFFDHKPLCYGIIIVAVALMIGYELLVGVSPGSGLLGS
ncbi:MAG: hypothetical protein LBL67_04810 [Coriobacteriales bacterium]|jgi:hypothetical protein|nr:hypothetical protein [Coriobacteriales bacterium]